MLSFAETYLSNVVIVSLTPVSDRLRDQHGQWWNSIWIRGWSSPWWSTLGRGPSVWMASVAWSPRRSCRKCHRWTELSLRHLLAWFCQRKKGKTLLCSHGTNLFYFVDINENCKGSYHASTLTTLVMDRTWNSSLPFSLLDFVVGIFYCKCHDELTSICVVILGPTDLS